MSESFPYSVGLNNVGSYQVSGMPFASGSIIAPASGSTPIKVSFPYVTSWVQIITHTASSSTDLRIGFSENGVKNGNFFKLHVANSANHISGYSPVFEWKVTELYFMSDENVSNINFDVVAGLTNIPTARINNSAVSPSGSNWSGSYSPGVG
jgi:hypothetical protein